MYALAFAVDLRAADEWVRSFCIPLARSLAPVSTRWCRTLCGLGGMVQVDGEIWMGCDGMCESTRLSDSMAWHGSESGIISWL
jgi:hypothetical protein